MNMNIIIYPVDMQTPHVRGVRLETLKYYLPNGPACWMVQDCEFMYVCMCVHVCVCMCHRR